LLVSFLKARGIGRLLDIVEMEKRAESVRNTVSVTVRFGQYPTAEKNVQDFMAFQAARKGT